jgi:hypothetical protein
MLYKTFSSNCVVKQPENKSDPTTDLLDNSAYQCENLIKLYLLISYKLRANLFRGWLFWGTCATHLMSAIWRKNLTEQNIEHCVHFLNKDLIFVQNTTETFPAWLSTFTGRQVAGARNPIAMCSVGGYANSAAIIISFLTISVVVVPSRCRPPLF